MKSLKKKLSEKIGELTEQECRELMALLQLTIDGIEELQQRFDVVGLSDKL